MVVVGNVAPGGSVIIGNGVDGLQWSFHSNKWLKNGNNDNLKHSSCSFIMRIIIKMQQLHFIYTWQLKLKWKHT